jgi:hypothetical protein
VRERGRGKYRQSQEQLDQLKKKSKGGNFIKDPLQFWYEKQLIYY